MRFGMWAYPWDLLDEGVDSVAARLGEMGVDEINLATNYHTVQTFDPHNPVRKTFFARANAYFHPDDRYGELRPETNPTMGDDDWVATVLDQLRDTHLSVNSWTIGCHNSVLGMRHRDKTLKTPFGDSLVFGLCPSHPTVQEYLIDLLGDLSDRGSFKGIQLETFHYFYGTGWSWHHDKFHAELGTVGNFLWGLCFCEHCRDRARNAGVNVESARRTAATTIEAIVEGETPPSDDVDGWIEVHPDVRDYVETRQDTLVDLYDELAATASTELGAYVGMRGVRRSWMHGLDLKRLSDPLDYFTVMAYKPTAEAAVADFEDTVSLASPDVDVRAGLLPAHPISDDRDTVIKQVKQLDRAGADHVSFYNYGLLPERNLEWVADAIDRVN